jgi:hypothetical protein
MEGNPSRMMKAGEPHLDEFADLARQLIVVIDCLPHHTAVALDAAGWHSGHAFALRADLARVVECAEKARRRTAQRVRRPGTERMRPYRVDIPKGRGRVAEE